LMNMTTSREWHLVRRPVGTPSPDDVELVEVHVQSPARGEVVVSNVAMSVEPYMWGRMTGAGPTTPYELGAPMAGHAVGTIVESAHPELTEGTLVLHEAGWRECAVLPADRVRVLDQPDLPSTVWLAALGTTGFTAYVGLLHVAACRPGDTVFVSAAAGAVGSTVAQIAKAMGCTVVGSAGSAAKVAFLLESLGIDAAFDYHDSSLRTSLADALERAGVDGIDVYFDNVGGEHLEAAIRRMRDFGRIALCGAISTYGDRPAAGPRNLLTAIWRRLQLTGFIIYDHEARRPEFERVMGGWLRGGRVRSVETVRTGGIGQAFPALLGLLGGADLGKTVVELDAH